MVSSLLLIKGRTFQSKFCFYIVTLSLSSSLLLLLLLLYTVVVVLVENANEDKQSMQDVYHMNLVLWPSHYESPIAQW